MTHIPGPDYDHMTIVLRSNQATCGVRIVENTRVRPHVRGVH